MAYTVPMTDILFRQRAYAPFIARYPGAWDDSLSGGWGSDLIALMRSSRCGTARFAGRRLGSRAVQSCANQQRLESRGTHPTGRVDQGRANSVRNAPCLGRFVIVSTPRRRLVRGTVKDSASGRPLPAIVIRIKSAPLGKHGEVLPDKGPEPWGTFFTDSAGKFFILNPPSGYAYIEAECPPSRGVRGAGLEPVALQPESGLDTVLNFRVRFASCAELAPAMAAEAKRHLEDVARAKVEAAARAVQGNIWGTLRDFQTGRPVARAWMRMDERGGLSGSDSTGRFWLWGFAPGSIRSSYTVRSAVSGLAKSLQQCPFRLRRR